MITSMIAERRQDLDLHSISSVMGKSQQFLLVRTTYSPKIKIQKSYWCISNAHCNILLDYMQVSWSR